MTSPERNEKDKQRGIVGRGLCFLFMWFLSSTTKNQEWVLRLPGCVGHENGLVVGRAWQSVGERKKGFLVACSDSLPAGKFPLALAVQAATTEHDATGRARHLAGTQRLYISRA